MKEYFLMFSRALDFKGKSTRREFWMAILFNMLASVAVGVFALPLLALPDVFVYVFSCLMSLYEIVVGIPLLSLTVRRLHDVGKSGWYLLLAMVLFVGYILLIVWLAQPSSFQVNPWYAQYKDNPDEIKLDEQGNVQPKNSESNNLEQPNVYVSREEVAKKYPNDSLEKIIDDLNELRSNNKISQQEYDAIMEKIINKK